MFGEFTVQIIERPGISDNRVFLFKRIDGALEFVTHKAEVRIVKEGEQVKDDEVYFADMSHDQLQAFAEALSSKGFKNSNDHKNAGLLEAKDAHLQDMRRLVFEPTIELAQKRDEGYKQSQTYSELSPDEAQGEL